MALRLLSTRVVRPFAPALRLAAVRGYATKYYTKEHEWLSVEGDIGTLGITDHAQQSLGDIVFAETPETGDKVEVHSGIGAIESVKAASDIYAPVSGEIVDVNSALADEPSLLNSSPEADGWFAKIKLANHDELKELLDESAYKALCEAEEH
ncbi:glycine cleavage system H protein [Radiomyces spectabilis]|uniref:glycine cleavage system H protein n=1 Tax=Radiomyces spectabilis TaxID=64574 RepID=UPI00221F0585|nr:glycine cleavage system H protein [Radiomyces spectabilis]KAI8366638.1 glycine cleavage system H protein [Radiomyces spectabilis]